MTDYDGQNDVHESLIAFPDAFASLSLIVISGMSSGTSPGTPIATPRVSDWPDRPVPFQGNVAHECA
jgi:hypothetical protein